MRTDATIDRQQVHLPNTSGIGFSKWKAQAGDFVVWNDNGNMRLCRVAGRVHFAPALGETPEIRDWLFLVVLNDSATSTWVRWVPPAEISLCFSPEDFNAMRGTMVENFFSADFLKRNPYEIAQFIGA